MLGVNVSRAITEAAKLVKWINPVSCVQLCCWEHHLVNDLSLHVRPRAAACQFFDNVACCAELNCAELRGCFVLVHGVLQDAPS